MSWKLLHLMQRTQIIDAAPSGKLNVQVFGPLYKTGEEEGSKILRGREGVSERGREESRQLGVGHMISIKNLSN